VRPDRIVTNAKARAGQDLILTKPLGTGIVSFAAQIGRAPNGSVEAAAQSMAALNAAASKAMIECGVEACTDVTGFGLIGHLGAMAAASGVEVEIVWDDLPLLPGVLECLGQGIASGAVERNRESFGACVVAADPIEPAMLDLGFDPQTSGGLLIAVSPTQSKGLLERLHASGAAQAAMVGRVVKVGAGCVFIRNHGRRPILTVHERNTQELSQEADEMGCCENGHEAAGRPSNEVGVAAAERKFQEFLRATGASDALDAKTKQAVAIALSVLARCEPCVKTHIKKALAMGFSQEEIDEAAWMAIGFGGSPTMVFYKNARNLG
ncbi:MAG: selenide, water dikinase SelD, partial [Thermoguttaceae bacterium]